MSGYGLGPVALNVNKLYLGTPKKKKNTIYSNQKIAGSLFPHLIMIAAAILFSNDTVTVVDELKDLLLYFTTPSPPISFQYACGLIWVFLTWHNNEWVITMFHGQKMCHCRDYRNTHTEEYTLGSKCYRDYGPDLPRYEEVVFTRKRLLDP